MGNQYTEGWSVERVERLRMLFRKSVSYTQIGAKIGVSRNAVASKLRKLGLYRREGRTRTVEQKAQTLSSQREKDKLTKREKRAENRATLAVGPQVQAINRLPRPKPEPFVCQDAADVAPLHLDLLQLTSRTCKWPYGNGPFTFCGNPTGHGVYCLPHFRLSRGPGTRSEQHAARVSRRQAA